MKLLVFGGAGFIGGTTSQLLAQAGHEVVVFDDLSTGRRENVGTLKLIEADICDRPAVAEAVEEGGYDAVLHFAGKLLVGESVKHPHDYYRVNVLGSLNIIDSVAAAEIPIIFSSSAAVYGEPEVVPIVESAPTHPTNPYGWSKLMVEQLLSSYVRSHGLRWVALRYFNAAGAHGSIGDHETAHLIPAALTALTTGEPVEVFGSDYPTDDGTCVRDYVHVEDLAQAHILAVKKLAAGTELSRALNLGTSNGASVKQLLDSIDATTGRELIRKVVARRAGDPARLLADSSAAKRVLDWKPQKSLDDIIKDAWQWQAQNQN